MYQAFACNLGAKLYTSARMWRHPADDHQLLFVPDVAGLPVLVTERVVRLLRSFDCGATVGEVMSSAVSAPADFDSAVTAIGFLEERGFLRSEPDPLPYSISAPERLPTEMTVWLHVTNSCNLGCHYCFVQDKTPGNIDQRTLNLALDRIVSTIQANGLQRVTVKLAGGRADPGQLFQEDGDSLTIQVGSSLIDIPKKYVLTRRDVDAVAGEKREKIVDVTISKDAKVMQRIPVLASSIPGLAGGIGPVDVAAACACACECNCACDCACGSKAEMTEFLRTMAFRNPMIARGARRG